MTGAPKKRLGRGLAALIGDDTSEDAVVQDVRSLRHMPIELLKASPNNPRKHFAEADLDELANSIRDKGLLQPIVVRPRGGRRLRDRRRRTALARRAAGRGS